MLIEQNPVGYLDYTIASWTKTRNLSAFSEDALAQYRTHYATPEHIHATCNDYRAGATFDLKVDEDDRALGRRISCPTLALWGNAGIPSETASPLGAWREWCDRVEGHGIDAGHFLAEENPDATLAALLPFLERHAH
jgi:haloacetate dehalogenase